jgi:hypothetical protein
MVRRESSTDNTEDTVRRESSTDYTEDTVRRGTIELDVGAGAGRMDPLMNADGGGDGNNDELI